MKTLDTREELMKSRKEFIKTDIEIRESKGTRRTHDDRRLFNPGQNFMIRCMKAFL